jgi:hypothetical protein
MVSRKNGTWKQSDIGKFKEKFIFACLWKIINARSLLANRNKVLYNILKSGCEEG